MWTDLSMKDKSELMSLFLKQGISSLSDMRRIYDGEQDIKKEIIDNKHFSDYPDTSYSLRTFNSPFLKPDTLLLNTLPQEQDIPVEEETIDERLSSGYFHIPNDLPEVSFTQKVSEINQF